MESMNSDLVLAHHSFLVILAVPVVLVNLLLLTLDIPLTKFSKGLYVNVYPSEWLGLRLALNRSFLEGSDDEVNLSGGREFSRWRRNLYFQSKVTELYFGFEFYPTVFLENYDGFRENSDHMVLQV